MKFNFSVISRVIEPLIKLAKAALSNIMIQSVDGEQLDNKQKRNEYVIKIEKWVDNSY